MRKEPKKNAYQIVTDKIIDKLNHEIIPWRRPWAEGRPPFNLITKKPYRGINAVLLGMEGYDTSAYLSFNQVRKLGGSVLKGEKAHFVVFYSSMLDSRDTTKEPKRKTVLRYYKVFNVAQCANLPARLMPKPPEPFNPIERCEEVLYHMPKLPRVEHGGDRAYYQPVLDYINMPPRDRFNCPEDYYAVKFHELVHSTGHETRLGRKEVMEQQPFGSESYSMEELVAEIGACFLKSITGIATDDFEHNAAYIQNWLRVLRGDPKFVIHASSRAQKAVDYILNVKWQPVHLEDAENIAA